MEDPTFRYAGGWKKTFHAVALDYLTEFDLYEMHRNMGGNKPNILVYYKHLALLIDFD